MYVSQQLSNSFIYFGTTLGMKQYINLSNTIDTTVEVEKTKTTYNKDNEKKLYFKSKQGVVTQYTQHYSLRLKYMVCYLI